MTDAIEIKKHAYRQTQDGIVISFVMHPNDVPDSLAVAPLGTRYYAVLVDADEYESSGAEPVNPAADSAALAAQAKEMCDRVTNVPIPHGIVTPQQDSCSAGVKRKWDELSYAQQAAIRCNEPDFIEWVGARDEDESAEIVRLTCQVVSRRDILPGTPAGKRWAKMDSDYHLWKAGARP